MKPPAEPRGDDDFTTEKARVGPTTPPTLSRQGQPIFESIGHWPHSDYPIEHKHGFETDKNWNVNGVAVSPS